MNFDQVASQLAGKRVLVTGHTGFKGAWLSLWLRAMGAEVAGFSLLPGPRRIESIDAVSQLSLVLTSACALGAVSLILLSMLLGAGSTPLLLLAGGMLLLIDDRGWGWGLERGLRRYVIPFAVVSMCLWIRVGQEMLHASKMGARANLLP